MSTSGEKVPLVILRLFAVLAEPLSIQIPYSLFNLLLGMRNSLIPSIFPRWQNTPILQNEISSRRAGNKEY